MREWIALQLVRLASWIYPKSEAVYKFRMQQVMNEMVYGKSIVQIDPRDLYLEPKADK